MTCNYEARRFGVTKLMYLKDALKKCPQLSVVSGEDLSEYRKMSYRITGLSVLRITFKSMKSCVNLRRNTISFLFLECLTKFSPSVERLGFDENFIDVTDMIEIPPWKNKCTSTPTGHVWMPDSTESKQDDT